MTARSHSKALLRHDTVGIFSLGLVAVSTIQATHAAHNAMVQRADYSVWGVFEGVIIRYGRFRLPHFFFPDLTCHGDHE